jgi:transposase
MRKARREVSPEFKREAVALLESSSRPQMPIAAELGIQPSMLRNWRAIQNGMLTRPPAGQAATTGQVASPADLASENTKLRRELERTRMERDVLKKAIGIFAEVPR